MTNKIILEKSLQFNQFQNLIILTISLLVVLLGFVIVEDYNSFIAIKFFLFFLITICSLILMIKKGLCMENQKLYFAIFLFGLPLRKKGIAFFDDYKISINHGRLTTNYGYVPIEKKAGNWEPNLNVSVKCYSIILFDKLESKKKEIITLTNYEKTILAVDFILKNTIIKKI